MHQLLKIEFDRKMPKYQQIVNSITTAIRQKKLTKGDPISSINELSDEFMLSRDTVQKAYNILRKNRCRHNPILSGRCWILHFTL